jgi:hypothetical protein
MSNLRDESAWWRTVSGALDKPHITKNTHKRNAKMFEARLLIGNWPVVRHLLTRTYVPQTSVKGGD